MKTRRLILLGAVVLLAVGAVFLLVKTASHNVGAAGITLVQKASSTVTSAASLTTAFPSAVTSGNLIVVTIASWPNAPTNVTDTVGNAYSLAGAVTTDGGGAKTSIYYAKNITGGTDSVKVSTASGTEITVDVAEFAGADPTSPLDATAGGSGNSTAPSSGSMSPAASGELIVGVSTHDAQNTVTSAGTGFTMVANPIDNPLNNQPAAMEYQVQAVAAPIAAAFTLGTADNWGARGATFKAAAQGPTPGAGDVVLLYDGATLPSGWSCISCVSGDQFFGVFPRASSTYGASTGGSDTGTHTATFISMTTGASTAVDSQAGSNFPLATHTHAVSNIAVSTADIRPPFKNLRFIEAHNPAQLPAGAIGMFDVSSSSLPSGWTYYSAMAGNYLRGENATTTGGSATHTHTITATLGAANNGLLNANRNSLSVAGGSHTHTVSGSTPAANNAPPFITVVFAKLNATSSIPNGLIAMFGATPLPSNWTSVSDVGDDFNGFLIKGGDTYGATGGSATHTHATTTITSSGPSGTTSDPRSGSRNNAASASHTHNVTFTLDTQSSWPLYRDVIFAKYSNIPNPVVTQDHYQWYANANTITPSVTAASADAALAESGANPAAIRLRMNLAVATSSLATSTIFKLQFSTSQSGPWSDVGSVGSSTTWIGYDNASVSDGAALTSLILSSSTVKETYQENEPAAATPNAIPANGHGEWDWSLAPNGTVANMTYYFRVAYSDGTALDGYNRYPTFTTGPAVTIIFWDGASIPAGWTCISCNVSDPFYQAFPMGSSTYGASILGSDTGTHTVTYVSQTTGASAGGVSNNTGGSSLPEAGHVHPVTNISISTDDIKPPYESLKFIEALNPTQLPAGAIAAFDISSSSLPSGWTYYSSMAGRYLRGDNVVATGGSATHTHTITATLAAPVDTLQLVNKNTLTVAGSAHTHTVSGQTPSAPNQPPYRNVVFAQLGSTGSIPNDMIAMFDGAPSSTLWSVMSGVGQDLNGRMLQGSDTYGGSGGSATHTHATTTITSSGPSNTSNDPASSGGSSDFAAASNHTHDVTFTTDSQSSLPRYREVIFAKYIAGSPTLTQAHYQWFTNGNNITPGSSLAALDTPASGVASGSTIRLRMNVGVTINPLFAAGQAFKLQFATATGGPWSDVGAIGSALVWRGFDNASVTNGSTIPTFLLTSSTVTESYVEQNNSPANPNAVASGNWGEWDWVVQQNSATPNQTYYFRMVKSDGTALDTYSTYPSLTTQVLYQTSGSLTSDVIDTASTNGVAPNSIYFEGSMPVNTSVTFQFAASNSPSGPWSYVAWNPSTLGCDTSSFYAPIGALSQVEIKAACHNNKRYLRYKVYLSTTDNAVTPRVDRVILNYAQ